MDMLPLLDGLNDLSDIMAILYDRIADSEVLQSYFVTDGNVVLRFTFYCCIAIHDPSRQGISLFHIFNHNNANAIAWFMYHELIHHIFLLANKFRDGAEQRWPVHAP